MWNQITDLFSGPHDAVFIIKLVVILGGLLYVLTAGLSDLLRFSIKRIWAISGVCFDESIRRRVLWIIPLAILGLVIVVQLQQPFDEQDAIRQTTKFCLFATGMVVVISTIILACTNLPREIENRVIFTVVTKPTTRLEIVLGKITGFARVSATILLIMGVFSFGYLHFRAWSLESDLRYRLKNNAVESISRPTFQHYVDAGLLNAKTLADAASMNIYQVPPQPGSTLREPTTDAYTLAPFHLPANMVALVDPEGKQYTGPGLVIQVRAGYLPVPPKVTPGKPAAKPLPAAISVQIFDQNASTAMAAEIKGNPAVLPSADGSQWVSFTLTSNYVAMLTKFPFIFVAISDANADNRLIFNEDPKDPPVRLLIPVTTQTDPLVVLPTDPLDASKPADLAYTGREGISGQQVKGDPTGQSQACVFHFQNADIQSRTGDTVPIEFRVGVEKSGDVTDQDIPTQASICVENLTTGKVSDPILAQPDNNRPCYASIPTAYTQGGNFNLIVRCLSPDQWLNFKRSSVSIVQSENSFAFNLLKSTIILWLLSILVTSISVFCSTFLSWPIAVVLTLVILLGRWGVNQLGDAATAGVGRQFVQDFGVKDPAAMQVLSGSVEELNKALKAVATVLPDIEQFSATEDIERGISIPASTVQAGLIVLLCFGVPLTLLAYIFLKNKEVAP
jgi:ABC-type transport system involved in multi-copper enzyme maturation permease subunit